MIDIKKFQPSALPVIINATSTAANGTSTQTLNTPTNSSPLYDVRVVNSGTSGQIAFVSWGGTNGSVTATSTTGQPVLGNTERVFNMGGYAQVFSAVVNTGTAAIYFILGQGD